MTNENLIKNLCDRANALWPPDDELSYTFVAVYVDKDIAQVWFSYWGNIKIGTARPDIESYIGEGSDLHAALIRLDSYLSIEEAKHNKKLEQLSQQYLMEHRELILADIGWAD